MKSLSLLASLCFVLGSSSAQVALPASGSFTSACMPVVAVTGIASTIDCFYLSASLMHPGATDNYYTWSFGDGTPNETGRLLNHCYASETVPGNTTRTVTLTYFNPVLNCGGSSTTTLNVSVIPESPCPNVPPSYTRAASTVTVMSGSLIPEIVTQYDFGDGSGSGLSPVHTYTACGNYIVSTTYWDMNMPDKVCQNFVAVNLSCSTPTGIYALTPDGTALVFPNPATEKLYVDSSTPVSSLSVTDACGRTVLTETPANPAQPVLEISHLAPGTYFLTIGFKSGARQTSLLVKE